MGHTRGGGIGNVAGRYDHTQKRGSPIARSWPGWSGHGDSIGDDLNASLWLVPTLIE